MGGGGGAESHLHGLGDGEAELSSSFRSRRSLASASDASFRSSVGSSADLDFDGDDDDDDGDFLSPRPQSEYEEIPSFRWIASPLRWWKTRKRSHLSKRSPAAAATASGPREEPSSEDYYTELYYVGDRRVELIHYDVPPAPFTIADLLNAEAEVMGEAAHGTSYKVMLEDGKGVLAVKRLRWEGITSEFGAKIKMLGKIRHPNILTPKAYLSSEEIHLLVLDYMPVGSLSSVLHADGPRTPFDWPTRMNIAIEASRGLRYLHMEAKLLHGNLTSVNVQLDEQANAKIADCSLFLLVTPTSSTEDLAYRAPEISKVEDMNNADTKTDVYSLGVIFLELLTGKSPWEATDGLDMPQWVASAVKEHSADKVFDPNLMGTGRVSGTMRNEMLDTLTLALSCVDPSPDERPKVQRVLQQLEGIKSGRAGAGAGAAAKAQGDHRPAVEGPGAEGVTGAATSIIGVDYLPSSSLDKTMEERRALPVEGAGAGPPASSQNDLEEDDHTPTPTSAEEINQDNSGNDEQELPTPGEGDVEAPPHSQDQSADTHIEATAAEFAAPMSHRPNGDSSISSSAAQPEDGTGETSSYEGVDATSDGTAVSPLSSIDWAKVAIDVRLEAPSSPPLISSDPDLIYQRYFQMLYDLAHRSPPLPSDVLEVQLNKMVIGLQSLGYPLETWLKAATLVLVTAKKREYTEQHVEDCKLNVETQLKVLASVVDPVKEELSRAESDIATLELEEEELDETISKLHDQLALLESRRREVGGLLTTVRDQIAEAEAKVEPLLVAMSRLNQQHSSILDLQRGMLHELPSLEEAFDGSFREILTKKF